MSTSWNWDFFIAHATPDKIQAESLYNLLSKDSRVFLDSFCIELGDNYDTKLSNAQKTSLITVVLVSSNTEHAYYEREEIATAIALARESEQKHRVVPIYLDKKIKFGQNVPYGLRLKHGLQLSDSFTLANASKELLALLKRLQKNKIDQTSSDKKNVPQSQAGILHQPSKSWISPVRSNQWRYKVVAFDLDGTLLRGDNFKFSWEAVWQDLSFGKDIQNQLKREYRQRSKSDPTKTTRIRAYQDWCDKACSYFKSRGLTRDQLKNITKKLRLTQNCCKALTQLKENRIVIAIISGGINTFLEDKLKDYHKYIDFVFINELLFDSLGVLDGVRATPFDFEGKADALDIICKRVGCTPTEVVFVGDHFNDEAIMLKVDKAIAYPPQDATVAGVSHTNIEKDDLMEIIPHVLVR